MDALREGQVTLRGHSTAQAWALVDPCQDSVTLRGQPLHLTPPRRYALFHKPAGYLTAMADPHGRPCLGDLLPPDWTRHSGHIGRLDKDTTGALLLSDDGDLNWLLSSPGEHIWKRYLIHLAQPVSPEDPMLDRLRSGLEQGGRPLLPTRVELRTPQQLLIWLQEGRNRQIRRMMKQVGWTLEALHREAIGELELGDLPQGELRLLEPTEVATLYQGERGLRRLEERCRLALRQRLEHADTSDHESTIARRHLSTPY